MKQFLHSHQHRIQRGLLSLLVVAIASVLFVNPAWATGVYDLPVVAAGEPTWIVDDANVLSLVGKSKIDDNRTRINEQTGTEARFVTVRKLDYGETIESFTNSLFEAWYPTPEAQANQILLVLDTLTNNSAIRVGDGVNPALTEEIARSVASETLMVPIREGDKYNEGFVDASDRLVAVLSGEPDPGPPQVRDTAQVEGTFATAEETAATKGNSTVVVILLLIGATVIPMVTYYVMYR
ncbi:MAG: YgcG family protein [Cyanobacteria bacterium J055]|nr:MAG: YgcG family protein [Cyanobacteria bacterium J055]